MAEDWVLVSSDVVSDPTSAPDYLAEIGSYIDSIADPLWPINKKIHDNPELGYKEYIAHEALTSFLKTQKGWKVTPSAYGMETAFVAVFDSGKKGPVVSFNAEMGGGGKIKLIEAGAYKSHGCDINLISHPGITSDSAVMRTAAYRSFKVEYFGREAHAAACPWLGINALDGLITAYTALSVLRQQTQPGDVLQGNITHGGVRPNIIHAYAAGDFVVRADTRARCDALFARAARCFEAGALSSGAKLVVTDTGAYADHVPSRTLARHYRAHFNRLGGAIPAPDIDEVNGRTMASTDQGDVSYALPSLSAGFWIRPGEQGNGPHSPDFAGAAGTKEAFGLSLRVGKGLAATAVDFLTKKGLVEEAWKEFHKEVKAKR
ncbi:putative peptidase m20 protein [Neofusicoccum parvum UCRNP2]|uniref:Peptidase M20 domain-containing protein 2 n=1 Tax=Botryosphaeria parva (strain UCR-NP2) TaxID=1287680 RepID=R1G6Z7_BOTPV|nr:putative peptidase m20 protein [Neofusicoccum parvum UCRNP2]